ncbi:CoA-transferase family III [Panus rudis PR-1116 ss-1]|nr:CoA-transferase family III [Panus rudis PR-1116 ss-1]
MSEYMIPAQKLWEAVGLPPEPLSRLVLSEKPDPAVNSSFKLGSAAQTVIGLSGLAAAHLHELRTSCKQSVRVNARHAVIEFKSEQYYTLDGKLPRLSDFWDDLAGVYETKDNNYVRIHTNFPHHRKGILDILGCESSKQAIAEALLQWNSVDFETEAAQRNMVATAMRQFSQWDEHPQGKALAGTPPVELIKVGDAPKRQCHPGVYPLEGIRVLDLTRVLAGPVCGRTLAAHGADVLLVTSPNLPALPLLDTDTSRGKRTTQLDLTDSADKARLFDLVKDADVFLQAYRPGGLRDKGFGVDDVVQARPGIVYASLNAYGWNGPWKHRRGFDSLVQTATGFNVAEAEAYATYDGKNIEYPPLPKPLPMQALDHAAGYLLAFGINAALCKTITEGGSWEVRVSLAAVGQWIRSLGQLDPSVAFGEGKPLPRHEIPLNQEIEEYSTTYKQWGDFLGISTPLRMTAIKHAAELSETPVKEHLAPIVLDAHHAVWLPRP